MSSVYILKQTGTNKYKIGVSNNVKERISQLQCGNSDRLVKIIYRTIHNAYEVETYLHGCFHAHSCAGGSEWFELNEDQLQYAINYIKNIARRR